ncbi:MAG: EcsC family protein [Pseudomonadota bacterium]
MDDDGVPTNKDQLSEAIKSAIERQRAFEDRRATRLGRGAEGLTAPLAGLLSRLIPPALARQALHQADWAAGLTVPQEITGHDVQSIAACDKAAMRVQAWAQGSNAATGGAAGWFGAAGLALDVPATIALAARNVRATGAAYGFVEDDENERTFRLMVLEVATALATDRRADSIENLNALAREMNRPEVRMVLDHGAKWMTEKVIERLARQLGLSLAGRKAGQVIPVLGSAVGATVNASFQVDVSRAARYAYRQRWLMARQALPAPEAATTAEPEDA